MDQPKAVGNPDSHVDFLQGPCTNYGYAVLRTTVMYWLTRTAVLGSSWLVARNPTILLMQPWPLWPND